MFNKKPRQKSFGKKRAETNKELFVGRKEQIEKFSKNIQVGPDSEDFINIFTVFGQGGVGKTTLITQYLKRARNAGYWTAFVDTEDTRLFEVRATMNTIAEDFKKQGTPFNRFAKRYEDYLQEKGKLEADPDRPKGTFGKLVTGGLKASAKVSAEFIPGGNIASEYLPIDAIANTAGEWAEFAVRKLGNKDEVELILNPLKVLTPLWLEDLYDCADTKPIALFFDTYETANPELDTWLYDLLNEKYGDIPANIVLVISGRETLNPTRWNAFKEYSVKIPLKEFTPAEAKQYLQERSITSEKAIKDILAISGCLPVYLSLLAENDPASPDDISDPNEQVVERFLKHIKEPIKRRLALQAALPRQLNKDIVAALLPETTGAEILFDWLKSRPFVQKRGGHWAYHPTVRKIMLQHQKDISEKDWESGHNSLANFYQERVNNLELPTRSAQYENKSCVAYLLENRYHLLCANYTKGIPFVIRDIATTLRIKSGYQCLPWAVTIKEAELLSNEKEWGKLIEIGISQLNSEGEGGIHISSLIQKINTSGWIQDNIDAAFFLFSEGNIRYRASEFNKALAHYNTAIKLNPKYATAYSNRGSVHYKLEHLEDALADYNTTIELNPKYATAYSNRGNVLVGLGRSEQALADYNTAIKLNPKYATAYSNRGNVLVGLDRSEQALADYNIAIKLNTKEATPYYNRGNLLVDLGRSEQALADYNTAIELNPEHATTYSNRGNVLVALGRSEQALADYNTTIELNPKDATAYYNRGTVLGELGCSEQALADYNTAIELNPKYATAYSNRGNVLGDLGRPEEALVNYNTAIELNPKETIIYSNRGTVLSDLGCPEQALTDYNTAIELNSKDANAYFNRGTLYNKLGRPKQALADYNTAIELNPKEAIIYYNRGNMLSDLDRPEEALADYDTAIELNPKDTKAYSNRGTVLSELGRTEKALADYNTVIELNPKYATAYYNRGTVYHKLDRPEEALADYNTAIELNPQEASFWLFIGWQYLLQTKLSEAETCFQKAWELSDNKIAHAPMNLGHLHLLQGNQDGCDPNLMYCL